MNCEVKAVIVSVIFMIFDCSAILYTIDVHWQSHVVYLSMSMKCVSILFLCDVCL